MTLTELSGQYRADRQLRTKTFVYSANRFRRVLGVDLNVLRISDETILRFRKLSGEIMAPETVENTITDVLTLVRYATGADLKRGQRLRRKRPHPNPPPVDNLSAAHEVAPLWLKQYLEIAYWTGLRPSDAIDLQREIPSGGLQKEIRWVASKTGIPHVFPPATFRMTEAPELPYTGSQNDIKRLRAAIDLTCEEAKISRFTPKKIRQAAVTEWSKANGQAGAILHGSGLGILSHYVDPLGVLQSAARRVRIPESFQRHPGESSPDEIPNLISRLDPEARALVLATAQRLAT